MASRSSAAAGGSMSDAPPIIRASERQKLLMLAQFRRGGQTVRCDVVNLSESGCMLRLNANFVEVGDTVFIKPEKLETLAGTVRWMKAGWLGVEFHQTVYRPVVDHLVRASFAL